MEVLRIFQNFCICCVESVAREAVMDGACAQSVLSALWILTWSLFSCVTSLLHCPCPFSRTSWHQDLWSQGLNHHPGLVLSVRASCGWVGLSSGLGLILRPRLLCVYLFFFVSVGYYDFLYLFRVLVSFSSVCPSSLSVIFPVLSPKAQGVPAQRSL